MRISHFGEISLRLTPNTQFLGRIFSRIERRKGTILAAWLLSTPLMTLALRIKGEITGSESVHIEGKVEGSIALPDDRVTVGRNSRVSANIAAQDIRRARQAAWQL
jgi:hypothetical protein